MPRIIVASHKRKLRRGYVWQKYYTIAVRHISRTDLATTYRNLMEEVMTERERWTNEVIGFMNRRAEELGLIIERLHTGISKKPKEGTIEEAYWKDHDDIMVWVVHALLLGPVERACYNPGELPMVGFYPKDIKDIINKNLNMQSTHSPFNVTQTSLVEAEAIPSEPLLPVRR